MRTDISKIHDNSKWTELTPGNHVYGGGTSKAFNTGEWRTSTPVLDESKCVHCLLCAPVCPDSCIPVVSGKRLAGLRYMRIPVQIRSNHYEGGQINGYKRTSFRK